MNRQNKMYRAVGAFNAENEGVISGVAIVFNTPTLLYKNDCWTVSEEIDSKACDNALERGDDVRCLFNHNADKVLGRTKNGSLKLWKENDGIHFECQTDTSIQWQSDLCKQIKRGDINQCSFAFTVNEETVKESENGVHYIVNDLRLYDVSVVTYPAYETTTAEARDFETARKKAVEKTNRELKLDEIKLLAESI